MEFIECGGYKRPELWLSDGWDYIQKHNINKPMYWMDNKYQFCLTGKERIDNDQPVSHISFYEADAFCKFKKKGCQQNLRWNYFCKKIKKTEIFLKKVALRLSIFIMHKKIITFVMEIFGAGQAVTIFHMMVLDHMIRV